MDLREEAAQAQPGPDQQLSELGIAIWQRIRVFRFQYLTAHELRERLSARRAGG